MKRTASGSRAGAEREPSAVTPGYEKAPQGYCQGCRRPEHVVQVGERTLCGHCLGAREPSAPKRLQPFEWGEVARELQVAVGRVMWLVPFRRLIANGTAVLLELPEEYVDGTLAPHGWRRVGKPAAGEPQLWKLTDPGAVE